MKKVFILPVVLFFLSACTPSAEQAFNESGRAKAVEDPHDLWQSYEDISAGFSVQYPIGTDITIESDPVDELEGTMGYDRDTARQNVVLLESGQTPLLVDWAVDGSQEIRKVIDTYGQDFVVLRRFEICDMTFQRKLYFFHNDEQVIITVYGDRDLILPELEDYLTTDELNCGTEKIWSEDGEARFYADLKDGKTPAVAQEWFDLFEEVVGTIKFLDVPGFDLSVLQGRWVSAEDENYVVEFEGDEAIDYYDGLKVSEGYFRINNEGLMIWVDDVMEYEVVSIDKKTLVLSYLSRGNTLRFLRED
jgi:hypothetical protein